MFRFDGVDSGSTRRADLVDVVGRTWSDCDRLVGVALVSCRRRSGVLAGVAFSLIENAALPWNSFWKRGASTPRGVWPIA